MGPSRAFPSKICRRHRSSKKAGEGKGRIGGTRHSSAGLSLGGSRQPSPQFSRREEKGEGGAYGDDVAVAPGEDVAAAEDGAHRVDELADVPVHAAALPFFPDAFWGLSEGWFDPWEGGVCFIRGFRRATRGMDGLIGLELDPEGAKQRKEAVSDLTHRISGAATADEP